MTRTPLARTLRLVCGSALILIGVIGGFVPILQGWIFVVAGLTLMAPESETARRILDWVKARVKRQGTGRKLQVETVESGCREVSSKEDETGVG